jgi:hypothetical protein
MATTTTRSRSTQKATAKPESQETVQEAVQEIAQEAVVGTAQEAVKPAVKEAAKKPMVPKDIDQHTLVTVRNGFQGRLIYKSSKTGERFVWDTFGAEQDMEIGEVRNARNSNKKFFINNWFMFDEPWVADYIGMGQYYKFALSVSDFDEIFTKPPEELTQTLAELSDGQRNSVSYRARQLIADGTIDSNRTITALEQALGVELVERDR